MSDDVRAPSGDARDRGAPQRGPRRRTVLAAGTGAAPALAQVMGAGATAQAAPPRPEEDAAVYALTVEHRTDPLGVDAPHPRLGWRMRSGGRGRGQDSYEILVAESPGRLTPARADVWNSGRVLSAESSPSAGAGPRSPGWTESASPDTRTGWPPTGCRPARTA
ncbi:glycoside hydrolase family 78 protein [Streptomyces sp. NPDC002486]